MMTELMLKVRDENIVTCSKNIEEQEYYKSLSKPLHVCIAKYVKNKEKLWL